MEIIHMPISKRYENYPIWIVLVSNASSLLLYATGFLITLRLHWIVALLYLIYILALEFRLIRYHCTNCFYWGKICGFGKGKVSSWFFRKGDNSKFCLNPMTWKDMIPDMLVPLIPFVIGIILLIIEFDIKLLLTVIIILLLTTMGNGIIRGSMTCKFCRQQELGCPADRLFNK
jgi:hypothetical protein